MTQIEMTADDGTDDYVGRGRIADLNGMRTYALAGNSTFTLQGARERFTYRVKKVPEGDGVFFVSVLSGPDNESAYQYAGLIRGETFGRTAKSRITSEAPSLRAFSWWWSNLAAGRGDRVSRVQFWHEGRCGRCGRTLTVPSSVARGIGPECASKMEGF